jgi:outer membrane protein assembly factor BamB
MGVVHLATSDSGLRLAVKVIHADYASDTEFRARFRQEVAAARKVSGAFTAPVVDADPEAERPWMATLFIEGDTLSERVKRSGPLNSDELVMLGAGLAEGLRDIHRAGVVHRDLKPSNVLLAADGPKVIDFGISRPTDSDLRTETGKLIGTPPFMAPEQFQRPREVGPAADVFAMGAVLVHAATGRGPFDSDSPYVVAYQVVHNEPDLAGVPEGLVPLIEHCLAKDPADRPTPDDLMAMLRPAARRAEAFVPAQRGPSRDDGPEATVQPWTSPSLRALGIRGLRLRGLSRRRKGGLVAACVVVAALAAAGVVAMGAEGGSTASGARARQGAGPAFRPWSTMLHRSTGGNGTPVCTVGGKAVYCSAPGVVARLDAADGHIGWSVKTAGTSGPSAGGAEPFLANGLLYVVPYGRTRLEARDPATGAKRWDADISGCPTVRYVGDAVLLMSPDGRQVRSLDSATGAERWTRRLAEAGSFWAASSGTDGPLFVATAADDHTTTVRAIDPGTGTVLWEKHPAGTLNPVAVSGGALFLLSRDSDDATDAVVRVDIATHAVRRVPLPSPVEQTQATVAGDTVYLIAYTGSLLAVDTRRATQLWRLETSVTRSSPPVVAGDRVYLSAGDGRLLAVDAAHGVLLGQTKLRMRSGAATLSSLLPAPLAAPGEVIASAPDGSVFAVDSRDPSRW